jgi:hypothetical protein
MFSSVAFATEENNVDVSFISSSNSDYNSIVTFVKEKESLSVGDTFQIKLKMTKATITYGVSVQLIPENGVDISKYIKAVDDPWVYIENGLIQDPNVTKTVEASEGGIYIGTSKTVNAYATVNDLFTVSFELIATPPDGLIKFDCENSKVSYTSKKQRKNPDIELKSEKDFEFKVSDANNDSSVETPKVEIFDGDSTTSENVTLKNVVGETLSSTLKVNATTNDGGELSYQWQKNITSSSGSTEWTDISGANSESYMPSAEELSTALNGMIRYRCVVTNTLNWSQASKTSAEYVVNLKVTAPTVVESTVENGISLTINRTTSGASIYYTTDDSEFSTEGNSTWKKYDDENKPTITEATTIRAIAVKKGLVNSEIVEESYYKVEKSSSIDTTEGDIDISPVIASEGTTINVTPTAKDGYQFDKATYTYSGTTCNITGTTFTMPKGNVTVNAEFISQTGTSEPAAIPVVSLVKDDGSETNDYVSLNGIIGQTLPTLKVKATVTDKGTLSYRWQKNTSDPETGSDWEYIADATDKTYTPPSNVTDGKEGKVYYRCEVTNQSNGQFANATSSYYEIELEFEKVTVIASSGGAITYNTNEKNDTWYIRATPYESGYRAGKVMYRIKSSESDASWIQIPYDGSTESYKIETTEKFEISAEFTKCEDVTIDSKEKLIEFANAVDKGDTYAGTNVKLATSIDLENSEWTPIGKHSAFAGNFDGGGNTVSNMKITQPDAQTYSVYSGFFAYVTGGSVKNLVVQGSIDITDFKTSEKYYDEKNGWRTKLHLNPGGIGGIVGAAVGADIENCKSYVTIKITPVSTSPYVGGIVGYATGSVSRCINYGDITMTSETIKERKDPIDIGYAGGIAGCSYNKIENCANEGNIASLYAAGISCIAKGSISGCANKGDITAVNSASSFVYDEGAAGIVYQLETSSKYNLVVENCYNEGKITAKQENISSSAKGSEPYCSGIAGKSTYNLNGTLGGFSGYNVSIKNCYNVGILDTNNTTKDDEKPVRYGEIASEYIYYGSDYNSYIVIDRTQSGEIEFANSKLNLSATLSMENCYTKAEMETFKSSEDAKYALGEAFKASKIESDAPLLEWEDETLSGNTSYNIILDIQGYTGDCTVSIKNSDGEECANAGNGYVYTLPKGKYTYTIQGSDGTDFYAATGQFAANYDKTETVNMLKCSKVEFTVSPVDSALKVSAVSNGIAQQLNYDSETGKYIYLLTSKTEYQYTVSKSGYNGVFEKFTSPDAEGSESVSLKAIEKVSGSTDLTSDISSGAEITCSGIYYLKKNSTGVITVSTSDPVTIVGSGVTEGDKFSDLTIKYSVPNADLTIENLYIQSNVDLGTSSGKVTNKGKNIIDFKGEGNTLNFSGTNLLENMSYVQASGIHVPKGVSLTIGNNSTGTLYMYKTSQGSGIGGDADEACGAITFAGGDIFIKGSKTGAVIGGDYASKDGTADGVTNDDITISGGNLNIVNKAMGAAIGASSAGTCAGDVYITGGVTTIISDYSGSAIGYGGSKKGSPGNLYVTGGTLKCVLTENATIGNWNSGNQVANDSQISAEKDNGNLALLVFDAKGGTVEVSNDYGTVTAGHNYYYSESNASTMSNWSSLDDGNVYLYLDKSKKSYVLTCGEKNYDAEWSNTDGKWMTKEINKQVLTAPALSTAESTLETVTLTPPAHSEEDAGASLEYRISTDGENWGDWQESSEFIDLMPDTEYQFQARYKAANTLRYADYSYASEAKTFKTADDPSLFKTTLQTGTGDTVTGKISGTIFSYYVEDGILTADVTSESGDSASLSVTIANDTLKALTKSYYDAESKEDIYYALSLNTDMGTVRLNYAAVSAILKAAGEKDAVLTMDKTSSDGVVTYSLKLNGNELENADSIDFTLSYERPSSDSSKSVVVYDKNNNALKSSYRTSTNKVIFTSYLGSFTIKYVENTSSSNGQQSGTASISSSVWDGKSLDVSWFTPGKSSYYISTPAQLAGLAALVNGIYNDEISPANIAGDSSYIKDNVATSSSDGGNNKSTYTYHYGSYNFSGATVYLTADIDMGGSNGANYMPIGGQYLMTKNDTSTKIDASFCGVFDGGGHTVTNISCDRHSSGNYGDGQSVGLIGRLGLHDNDAMNIESGTAVRNVAVEGTIYANRSVGGIVGKIGKTNGGATIENCANLAAVTATDAKGCGGIVGAGWNIGTIKNCYNAGTITSRYPNPTGGISGSNEVAIENCYNIGKISASSSSYAMAIGTNNGGVSTVTNCWYLEGSAPGGGYYSGNTADNSGSRTSEQMKTEDFLNTLGSAFAADSRNINNGYPVLAWQNPSGQRGTGSGSGGEVPATEVTETKAETTTEINGDTATVKADDKALTEAAKEADKNTQFVIKGDMGDADVSKVSTEVGKDTLKVVAEAQASVKVETPVANITLPNEALKDIAAQSGATVSVTAELKEDGSTTINLSVDSKSMTKLSGGIKAAIPVILDKISKGINRTNISDSKVPLGETPDSTESTDDTSTDSAENTAESTTDSDVSVDMNGLVAVLVSDDGTESIIPKSVIEDSTVYVLLDGSATVKVADNSKTFTDVADTWYTDAVNFAAGHELFNGVSGSEFAPLNKMSRAMLVTVLHRLEGTPSASNNTSFSDVESGKWYTDAISWANANDIVNGLGNSLFGTNNNITREQMATILYRYMNEQGLSVSASGDISSFSDGDSVSSYAEEAMSWAIGSGIITGKDSADGTLLDPKGNASRAEVAAMLKRMIGIMVK